MVNYSINFGTQAWLSEWNQAAQCDAFLMGLSDYVKEKLVSYDLPTSLDGVIELASRIDCCIQARQREVPSPALTIPLTTQSQRETESEPMQVSRTSLTSE